MLAPTDHVVGAGSVRGAGREAVFAEHQATLRGYCLRLSRGDRFAAEDLAQEAFVRYFARFGDGQPEHANVAGYLCATARNVYRNELRDRREVTDDDVARLCGADGSLERDPERATLLADQVVQVRRCTARMGERQRRALTLCDVDGRSYAEVGRTLDISTEAAAQLIARGRIRLRRELRCEQVHVARLPRALSRARRRDPGSRRGTPAAGPTPISSATCGSASACRTSLAAASEAGSRLRGIAPLPPVGGLLARIEASSATRCSSRRRVSPRQCCPRRCSSPARAGRCWGSTLQTAPPRVAVAAPGDDGPRSGAAPSAAPRPPRGASTGTTATGGAPVARRLVDDGDPVPGAVRAPRPRSGCWRSAPSGGGRRATRRAAAAPADRRRRGRRRSAPRPGHRRPAVRRAGDRRRRGSGRRAAGAAGGRRRRRPGHGGCARRPCRVPRRARSAPRGVRRRRAL